MTHPFVTHPHRTLLALSAPVMVSLAAEPLTALVDTAFVARLGPAPLAALGVATTLLSSVLWVFNFLSIGTQTELARSHGAGREQEGRRVASLALVLGALLGVTLALVAWPLAPAAVRLMGLDDAGVANGTGYLRVRLIGAPAVLLTVAAAGALRGRQDMRTPLVIALVVNALNLILDPLLIFGPGPFPRLELVGAGWASSVSQWLGAALAVLAVSRHTGLTSERIWRDAGRLFSIGLDLFLRTGALLLFLALATRAANRLGVEAGAAHQAVRQSWVFTAFLLDAYGVAAQSLVGFFLATGQRRLARRVAGIACLWGLGTGAVLAAGMLLGTGPVTGLLVPEGARMAFLGAWRMAALFQPLNSLSFVTDGIHWGTSDYRFLRNAVSTATATGGLLLVVLERSSTFDLTQVWLVTGVWIAVRAGFGVARIWPGFGAAPLRQP
ncbi:MAG: MATE family efflux transporter [Acidobacteria bacterium]|nr:MATE family efflux transporter [Acidobacteriota bacterium]